MLNRFLVALDSGDDVVERDETFNPFVEIAAILQVADVLDDVVDLALRLRVEWLLLGVTHFLDLLSQVLVVVHEMHLVVLLLRMEVDSRFGVAKQVLLSLHVRND